MTSILRAIGPEKAAAIAATIKDMQAGNVGWYMLIHGLSTLSDTQEELNDATMYREGSPKEMARTYTLAAIVELAELVQELEWKPWKPEKFDRSADELQLIAAEFADVLAFIGHIMRLLHKTYGLSPIDLATAYEKKSKVNLHRLSGQIPEYDLRKTNNP